MAYMERIGPRRLAGPTRRSAAGAMAAIGLAAGSMITWTGAAQAAQGGYADLVETVAPAVVYIEVTGEREAQASGADHTPFGPGGPLEDFFKRFGVPVPQQRQDPTPVKGVGSGFIIDGGGEIVTNNHVVEGADSVLVKLTDGRSFDAEVVGTDPMTDVALLKVKTDDDLPTVSFGASSKMRVGDEVIAVGNPFGLGGTVTTGIVSALSRNIHSGPYDDFIQTDAAINRGNSGGPLFNDQGEVIGMNTAIFSPSGGSVGIGFSVPSDMVKSVIAQIEQTGGVERGWLGVQIQGVTPELSEALSIEDGQGALVAEVSPGSPAAKAGLKQGDVIVSFAGQTVEDVSSLPRLVAAKTPGDDAAIKVLRGGETKSLTVAVGKLDTTKVASAGGGEDEAGATHSKGLGAELAGVDERTRERLGLPAETNGVLVTSIDPDGAAAAAQLLPGDVIEQVNGDAVKTPRDVQQAMKSDDGEKTDLLLINRRGTNLFVGLKAKAA